MKPRYLAVVIAAAFMMFQTAFPQEKTVTMEDGSMKIGDDIFIRAGALFQPSLELQQDLPTATQDTLSSYNRRWAHNLYVRRARLYFSGKVSKSFNFFFDYEVRGVGLLSGSSKNTSNIAVNLLDAQMSYIAGQEFSVVAGLILVGITRNGLQSAASLMPINYGAYTFNTTNTGGALDNIIGRDAALMFRGFLDDNRFEYRVSLANGRARNDGGTITGTQSPYSPFRVTARAQYDFLDKQTADIYSGINGFYYTGSYFGKKQVFAVGAGIDMQREYTSFAGDVFFDYPVLEGDGITVSAFVQHTDGGNPDPSDMTLTWRAGVPHTTIPDSLIGINSLSLARLAPKQTIFSIEAGLYIASLKLQPVVKFESRSVKGSELQQNLLPLPANATQTQLTIRSNTLSYLNDVASQSRFGIGMNYLPRGNNFNVKAMFEIISTTQQGLIPTTYTVTDPIPEFKKSYSLFTLQGQWFVF